MLADCVICIKRGYHAGLCPYVTEADKEPLRCVGRWARDKYFYLATFIDIFTVAMRKNWKDLYYIELFSGPGRCIIRRTSDIIDGSPLIALKSRNPFSDYHFVELEKPTMSTLKTRCLATDLGSQCRFYQGDCNVIVDDIVGNLSENSLGLAFIDPTGSHIDFQTVKKPTNDRRMDLVITFPLGVDIIRNIERYAAVEEETDLDRLMGSRDWRQIFENRKAGKINSMNRPLLDFYKDRLKSIGYKVESGDEVGIRSTSKNLPLYHILFASKHELGGKFWSISIKQRSSGQLTIPFAGLL